MNPAPLVKIREQNAAAICASVQLSSQARQLPSEGVSPREFVAALLDAKRFIDAIDFVAHALPAREGIWWGLLCMQHALGGNLTPADRAAATAALQWLLQPTEENRAAASASAGPAGPTSTAGSLALAAGLTGGSVHPPQLPFRPPEPFAPHKAVARAVKLASLKSDQLAKVHRAYVELGLTVAEGHLI